jgi:hypothetical protein
MGEHDMTTNNMTILYENSAPEEYADLLKGRYVTDITIGDDEMSATITLDNGTVLDIHGSCECSCGNGWTYMREAFMRGNSKARIMNAHVETTQSDERYDETDYTIFVMIDGNPSQLPLATMQGYDESGDYGTGFTIYACPASSDHHNNNDGNSAT